MTTEKEDYKLKSIVSLEKEIILLEIEAIYLCKRIEIINNQIQAVLLKYEYQFDDSFFIELINEFNKRRNVKNLPSNEIFSAVLEQLEQRKL
jgi:hypothetical protein